MVRGGAAGNRIRNQEQEQEQEAGLAANSQSRTFYLNKVSRIRRCVDEALRLCLFCCWSKEAENVQERDSSGIEED